MENKTLIESGNYRVIHFSEEYIKYFYSFSVNNDDAKGLVQYLQDLSPQEEKEHFARTYLVLDKETDEIAGYFSLRAGFVPWRLPKTKNFDSLPGVELAAIAVNETFRAKAQVYGLGTKIFHEFVIPLARQAAETIGIKTIYLFALPDDDLIDHYKEWGFVRLKPRNESFIHRHIKPKFDRHCIFMYQNLF